LRAPAGFRSSMYLRIAAKSRRARGVKRTLIDRGVSREPRFLHRARIRRAALLPVLRGSQPASHRQGAQPASLAQPWSVARPQAHPGPRPEARAPLQSLSRAVWSYRFLPYCWLGPNPTRCPLGLSDDRRPLGLLPRTACDFTYEECFSVTIPKLTAIWPSFQS